MVFFSRNSGDSNSDDDHQPQSFDGLLNNEDLEKMRELADDTGSPEGPMPTAAGMNSDDSGQGKFTSTESQGPSSEPEMDLMGDAPRPPLITPLEPTASLYPGVSPNDPESSADEDSSHHDDMPPMDFTVADEMPPVTINEFDDTPTMGETDQTPGEGDESGEVAPGAHIGTFESIEQTSAETEQLGTELADLLAEREEMSERLLELDTIAREARQLLEQAGAEQAQQAADFEQRQTELQARIDELSENREELDHRAQLAEQTCTDLRTQRDEIESMLHDLQPQLAERQTRIDTLEQALEATEARTAEWDASASQQSGEIDQLRSTIDEYEQELQTLRQQQSGAEQAGDTLRHQLSDTQERLEEAERRVEAMTGQLEVAREAAGQLETNASQFESELRERDETLATLRQQMETAREQQLSAQQDATQSLTARDARIQALDLEARDAQMQVRERQARIAELEQSTRSLQQEVGDARNRLDESIRTRDEQIQSLQEKLDTESSTLRQREESLEQLERRRDELQREYETERSRAAEETQRFETELAELRTQNEKYQQELEQLWSLRDTMTTLERERDEAQTRVREANEAAEVQAKSLDDSREKLQAFAQHLERRRTRMKRLHPLLKERSDSIVKERLVDGHDRLSDEKRKAQNERQKLMQTHQMLAAAEQKMLRLWAPQKSSNVTSMLVIAVALITGGSWYLAGLIFPPRVAASFSLVADPPGATELTEQQKTSWQTWHSEMPADTSFRITLLRRIEERQLPVEELDLDARLDNDLTIDAGEPGLITYTLGGTNRQETMVIADVLASSLQVESARASSNRIDRAPAVAAKEHKDSTTRYASLSPVPVEDSRLIFMGPIFAVLFAIALMIFKFMNRQYRNVKLVINSDLPGVEADEQSPTDD